MIYLVAFLIIVLASARTTRLITTDALTADWRVRIRDKYEEEHFLVYLISCDWCSSFWASIPHTCAGLVGLTYYVQAPWWLMAISFLPVNMAVAHAAALVTTRGE